MEPIKLGWRKWSKTDIISSSTSLFPPPFSNPSIQTPAALKIPYEPTIFAEIDKFIHPVSRFGVFDCFWDPRFMCDFILFFMLSVSIDLDNQMLGSNQIGFIWIRSIFKSSIIFCCKSLNFMDFLHLTFFAWLHLGNKYFLESNLPIQERIRSAWMNLVCAAYDS